MTGEVHLNDGTVIKTDSLRVDMDGGRIILLEESSLMYETNKRNWIQELIFYKNKKGNLLNYFKTYLYLLLRYSLF